MLNEMPKHCNPWLRAKTSGSLIINKKRFAVVRPTVLHERIRRGPAGWCTVEKYKFGGANRIDAGDS